MDKKLFVYFILLTLGHPHPNNHQGNVAGKTFLRKKNNNNNQESINRTMAKQMVVYLPNGKYTTIIQWFKKIDI